MTRKAIALLAGAALAATAIITTSSAPRQTAGHPEGWRLEWAEEFDSAPDSTLWLRIDRGNADWCNTMSKLDTCYGWRDGNLVLRGIANFPGSGDSVAFLTGGVYTKGTKSFTRGRLEVCAKLQGAKGAWPAIWLLPDPSLPNSSWPDGGEIDIMERLNNNTIAYQTVHSPYTLGKGGTANPRSGVTAPINRDDYNVYAVELYADSVCFFINGHHTNTYPRITTDIPGQFPFDTRYYLLIDMQLGGSWVGAVDPNDLPVEMLVDWVRFYKKE